jgi:hypothetical protein
MNLHQRVVATDLVVAKFRNRRFDWRNRATCIHLARAQARAMGHRPPPVPDIRSAVGARRALKALGHDRLSAMLDTMFPRIAPAAALPGDLVIVPGEDGFESIGIAAGGALFLYHADGEGLCTVKEALGSVTGAWRL